MSYLDDDLLKSIQQDMEQDKKDFKMDALSEDSPSRASVQELRESVRSESLSAMSATVSSQLTTSPDKTKKASTDGPSKVDKSGYYLYKSTDPARAEQYKPKKIDLPPDMDAPLEAVQRSKSKGSLWNASGATMEQYDYSEWFKTRLTDRICLLQFPISATQHARVESVSDIDCSATFIVTRGKLRPGYDVTFTAKWTVIDYSDFDPATAAASASSASSSSSASGSSDSAPKSSDKKTKKKKSKKKSGSGVEGQFTFEDICDSESSDEWGFACKVTKGSSKSVSRKAHSTLIDNKDRILRVITDVIAEFKAKRQ